MYPVLELAKYIVVKCIKDRHPISNLQLQKILYYVQRYFLQRLGKVAFYESIEAWPFEPVVTEVYYYFCGAGAMPITLCNKPSDDFKLLGGEREIVDGIVESKRMLYPWDLVEETHKPKGAWASVYREGHGNRRTIPLDKIRILG